MTEEWVCTNCMMVYPGPPQEGAPCVVCPRCNGATKPRMMAERDACRDLCRGLSGALKQIADLNPRSQDRLLTEPPTHISCLRAVEIAQKSLAHLASLPWYDSLIFRHGEGPDRAIQDAKTYGAGFMFGGRPLPWEMVMNFAAGDLEEKRTDPRATAERIASRWREEAEVKYWEAPRTSTKWQYDRKMAESDMLRRNADEIMSAFTEGKEGS